MAAFEKSLTLMTTRLQSLSVSHEQKVKAPPHFQTQNLNASCIPVAAKQVRQRSVSAERDDFDYSL